MADYLNIIEMLPDLKEEKKIPNEEHKSEMVRCRFAIKESRVQSEVLRSHICCYKCPDNNGPITFNFQ